MQESSLIQIVREIVVPETETSSATFLKEYSFLLSPKYLSLDLQETLTATSRKNKQIWLRY